MVVVYTKRKEQNLGLNKQAMKHVTGLFKKPWKRFQVWNHRLLLRESDNNIYASNFVP